MESCNRNPGHNDRGAARSPMAGAALLLPSTALSRIFAQKCRPPTWPPTLGWSEAHSATVNPTVNRPKSVPRRKIKAHNLLSWIGTARARRAVPTPRCAHGSRWAAEGGGVIGRHGGPRRRRRRRPAQSARPPRAARGVAGQGAEPRVLRKQRRVPRPERATTPITMRPTTRRLRPPAPGDAAKAEREAGVERHKRSCLLNHTRNLSRSLRMRRSSRWAASPCKHERPRLGPHRGGVDSGRREGRGR